MLISRLIFSCVAATLAVGVSGQSGQAFLAAGTNKHNQHTDLLHKAAHELKEANSAIGKNGNASHHLATAIHHLEHAIHHHKTNLAPQSTTGLGGSLVAAAHHKHHTHLQEALHAAKTAEKHLGAGKTAHASTEITKAHHHVELAMSTHHVLKAN
jgi:hypothetical protein